jgi:hypothetical protein
MQFPGSLLNVGLQPENSSSLWYQGRGKHELALSLIVDIFTDFGQLWSCLNQKFSFFH